MKPLAGLPALPKSVMSIAVTSMGPSADVLGMPSSVESRPPSLARTVMIDCRRISSPALGVSRIPSRAGSLPIGWRL
jgi:hypothetical protein